MIEREKKSFGVSDHPVFKEHQQRQYRLNRRVLLSKIEGVVPVDWTATFSTQTQLGVQHKMSSMLAVAVYGLKVPAGDVMVPAAVDYPATVSSLMFFLYLFNIQFKDISIDVYLVPHYDGCH